MRTIVTILYVDFVNGKEDGGVPKDILNTEIFLRCVDPKCGDSGSTLTNFRAGICIHFIDIQDDQKTDESYSENSNVPSYDSLSQKNARDLRKYYLVNNPEPDNDDKDEKLKSKIAILVEQTIHDTDRKIKSVDDIKQNLRDQAPYKIGFILSMVKKSKDVLSELFNVAVKHKDDWKALETLKVFELIVHTNVDTTNLVRQLVEIHIQHMNSTHEEAMRKRVVLLK